MPIASLDRLLRDATFVAFDLETTGLNPRRDQVVSIGAVRVQVDAPALVELAVFSRLINPGRSIPPNSTAIHGITDADVMEASLLDNNLVDFRAFIGDAVPLCHVAAFDLAFLARPLKAAGLPPIQHVLDTALLARVLSPSLRDAALETLADQLHVALTGRHTAIGDARICANVFWRQLDALQQRGVLTLGQALRFQGGDAAHVNRDAYHARVWF